VILSQYSEKAGWGLCQDAKIVEQVLKESAIATSLRVDTIDHIHPLSFYGARLPKFADIQIHIGTPCRAAWEWSRLNVVIAYPESWPSTAWNWVFHEKKRADFLVVKSEYAASLFPEVKSNMLRVIQWRMSPERQTNLSNLLPIGGVRKEFLYLVGNSSHKLAAAEIVCKAWKSSWPCLHIVGSERVLAKLSPFCLLENMKLLPLFPKDDERAEFQKSFGYHIVTSAAENFGFTFSEAAAFGALPLWNTLPVYKEYFGSILGNVGAVQSSSGEALCRDALCLFTEDAVIKGVESLLSLSEEDDAKLRGVLRHVMTVRSKEFRQKWKTLFVSLANKMRKQTEVVVLPPKPMSAAALPHVAVLTITHNRPKWFANMARNVLLADYPPDKLTWVIADDGSGTGRIDADVMKFQSANPRISVKYLSLAKKMDVGSKRNLTCASAPEDASVFVIMDDDDHYPASSIHRRVAWLQTTKAGCVYCATLPMYDCKHYISAINVPPLNLSACERVSEASLAFTREFWLQGKFPQNVSIAEGEGFVTGRESETVEMPPDGVIVSFLHGSNASSRRMPDTTEANGCHYGFDDEYFTYISGLGN